MIQDNNTIDIKIESSEYIKGNNIPSSTPSSLWLLPIESNVKLVNTNMTWTYNTKTFKENNKLEEFISLKKLKEALILLINEICILGGTIGLEDDKGNVKINLNNQGILWIEAKANKELDSVIPNRYVRYNSSNNYSLDCFTLNSYKFNSREVIYKTGEPIISIQITQFTCNSILISLSGQHCLFDGSTMGQFMNYWGELVKTGKINAKFNWKDRSFLMNLPEDLYKISEKKIKKPRFINYYKKNEYPQWSWKPDQSTDKKFINRIIYFTQEEIENLKKLATISQENNKEFLSSYDVLYAHFIHCIYLVQSKLNPNKYNNKIKGINIAQNYSGRNKFGFNFNNNHFGAFAFWLNGEVSYEIINNFSKLAYFIHNMHSSQTKENLIEYNSWLIPLGSIGYYENHVINDIVDKDFHISSWAKGNYYSAEFIEGIQPDYAGPSNLYLPKIMLLLDAANNKETNKKEYEVMLGLYENEYEELMKIIHKYK